MKKALFIVSTLLILTTFIYAIPQALHLIPVSKSKEAPYQTDLFFIQGTMVYTVNNLDGLIRAWDTTKKEFGKQPFAKLPLKAKANDITGDANNLFVLDSKKSAIYIYSYTGKLLTTISSKGSPAVQFKKAIRILVNYQGYIFILDAGRNELLSFTREGMFRGKESVLSPISMCLGEDQILRVLVNRATTQEVVIFDQDLKQSKGFAISTPNNNKDKVADIAINQYNELYVIYSLSTKIGKVDAAGRVLPKPWGSKDKGDNMQVFLSPAIIKAAPLQNNVLMGIWDSKTKTLKLYMDGDFTNLVKLETPQLTMRPFLEEINEPKSMDNLVVDSLAYYLYDATVQVAKAKKITRSIACKSEGRTLFSLYALNLAKHGVKSFDAMAIYHEKLFVVDSKASKVFVFNRLTGTFIAEFASKGAKEGQLNTPTSIAISPDGTVYVADWGNSRIAVFNENTAFFDNISLIGRKLKPNLLRIHSGNLYFLANGNTLYEMPLTNTKKLTLLASHKKISTFDILYDNRLGYIEGTTQQLHILFKNGIENKYFSFQSKSIFPGFGAISHIRYNEADKTLFITDLAAKSARRLKFFYSPKKPQTIRLTINKNKQAELSWGITEGINRWLVTEVSDAGTYTHNVSEPRYLIINSQQNINRYSVCAMSEDGKAGPSSEEIEDAYSYARYLTENKNYSQAVLALKRAKNTVNDPRLDDEMVENYKQESNYLIRLQEYEKALKSLENAISIKGLKPDLILATVDIYKLMKEYKQGITYLENFKAEDNQSFQKQLISLYYLDKNYSKVLSMATVYLARFGKDAEVIRYQALANDNLKNYPAALAGMRELITLEDDLDNNLKIGELLILTNSSEQAVSHLNRMLTRFPNRGADTIHKLLGDAYFAYNSYGYAAESYANAIRINPDNAEYYYMIGLTYFNDSKGAEAIVNLSKAFEIDPTSPKYGIAYAKALEKANRYSDALSVLDTINKFVTSEYANAAYYEFYADLLTQERRHDDAYTELSIAVKYDPTNTALLAKLQTASETRDYYNKNRPEIEMIKYEYFKLYPSLQNYYKTHPLGSVTLFNTRNIAIQDVKVTISIPQITDKLISINIPSIIAGQRYVQDIIVPVNDNIFTLCKNGPATIPTELKVEYVFNNERKPFTFTNTSISTMGVTAMNWNNRSQFASFINPSDENLRNFVNSQITQLFANAPAHQLNKNIQRAIQIWSYYQANGISYIPDPSSSNIGGSESDYVQFPFQTLDRKSGDCDDLLVLLASSLSVIGVDCGFLDIPGHVMLVIDPKMKPDEVMESGIDLNHFIYRNDKYWIPIETTLLDKESFSQSWLAAIKYYQNLMDKQYFPDLIEFADAHKLYPPSNFSEVISLRGFNNATAAQKLFTADINSILLMGQIAKEEEFIQSMNRYPTNLSVANQYALWCVQNNRESTAQSIWEQILKQDPANYASLVNLGSLEVSTSKYDSARIHFLEALKQNRDTDNILRNLCILEYRNGNKAKAREYYNRITDKSVLKNLDPQTYADLISGG